MGFPGNRASRGTESRPAILNEESNTPYYDMSQGSRPEELEEAKKELTGGKRSLDELADEELREVERRAVENILGDGDYTFDIDYGPAGSGNASYLSDVAGG
ncbi:MAG: hypothetical protein ABEJ66_00800 [Candidatus Nanohaloarchaea archaeon]